MTSNEVLSEIVAMDISKKNADELVARAHNARKPNLALKAKAQEESESDEESVEWGPEDLKFHYHEYMALAAKNFCNSNKTRGLRPRGFSPRDNSRYHPRDSSRGFSKSP
jgi:hypothetical protein